MANSFLKKTLVYLGLLDDEYEEYDSYEDRSPRSFSSTRLDSRQNEFEDPRPPALSRIRTLPRDDREYADDEVQRLRPRNPSVKPMSPADASKVASIAPTRFNQAKVIGDHLKNARPVIVNLQVAERDLQRRMIDFCSGLIYAIGGDMERVADQVFLLAPTNVRISEEERQRLEDSGYEDSDGRQDFE